MLSLSLSGFGLLSSAIRASKQFGITNSFVFLQMMADDGDCGVDDTDKLRLPSLGFVLSFVLFLFTTLLFTIIIEETIGWFCSIVNLV
jgi:hypothetical protein